MSSVNGPFYIFTLPATFLYSTCSIVDAALSRMLTILEEIKMQNQVILANQQHQLQRDSVIVPTALPDDIMLPLESLEQLLHLNICCQDTDVRGNLVSLFSIIKYSNLCHVTELMRWTQELSHGFKVREAPSPTSKP